MLHYTQSYSKMRPGLISIPAPKDALDLTVRRGPIFGGNMVYHPECTRSHLISEAKQGRAWLVLGWETTSPFNRDFLCRRHTLGSHQLLTPVTQADFDKYIIARKGL